MLLCKIQINKICSNNMATVLFSSLNVILLHTLMCPKLNYTFTTQWQKPLIPRKSGNSENVVTRRWESSKIKNIFPKPPIMGSLQVPLLEVVLSYANIRSYANTWNHINLVSLHTVILFKAVITELTPWLFSLSLSINVT